MGGRFNPTRRRVTLGLGASLGLAVSAGARALAVGLLPTPAQIEGPFYPVDRQADTDLDLTRVGDRPGTAVGSIILVRGRVFSIEGTPLQDALVEIWQANHYGRYAHPRDPNPQPLDRDFQGWGRVSTATDGEYGFRTIRPGPYSLEYLGGSGWRCRHIHFNVSHEGFRSLTTQMYFQGDPLLAQDAEIAKVPVAERPRLIVAEETDSTTLLPLYRFDVVLAAS